MSKQCYEFGEFQFDATRQVLTREGESVRLKTKACELLQVLIERRGEVLEKEVLMQLLWPDTVVEENNLTVHMTALRKALGDSPNEHRFIVTIPGRGYRFVADVRESSEEMEILVAERTRTSVTIEEEIGGWGDRETERQEVPLATATHRLFPRSPYLPISPSLLVGALLLALLALGAAYWWRTRQPLPSPIANLQSLAVLPFKPLVADARDEYLQMGMADVLITRLSEVRQIIVRPVSAVRKYAGLEQDAAAAGRELKVEAVLDGNFHRVGDRVRVTARLTSASDGATLWTGQFDEPFTDLLTIEDKLATRLASALTLQLTNEEQRRLARHNTTNPDAYQAYLKGRFFWQRWNEEGLKKAIEYFEQAIAADPKYAAAYSGLADAWSLLGYQNFVPPREAFPKSEAAARQALKLDDTLGEAHLSLAKTKFFYDWDFPGFERELQRALELSPNFADTHGMNGTYLTAIGKFDEAIAERKRALELNPLSPLYNVMVGWPYFYARRYDEAIEWYKRALELDPNFAQAYEDISLTNRLQGKDDEAIAALLKARSLNGAKPEAIAAAQQAYATGGFRKFWQHNLAQVQAQMKERRMRAWRVAGIYNALGDRDQTFAWLEKAYEERDSLLLFLKVLPQFEPLRNDPRFVDLLRRIGL